MFDGERVPDDASLEVQIADVESRLATLRQRFDEVRTARSAIAKAVMPCQPPEPCSDRRAEPAPTIDAGNLRASFGGASGIRVEPSLGSLRTDHEARLRLVPTKNHVAVSVRSQAATAVWNALDSGAIVVRIESAPGAGATTLLHNLAGGACDHGFADGALVLTEVRGPASDIAARLAGQLFESSGAAFLYEPAFLRQRLESVRTLVLLDRAQLMSAEIASLCECFPSFRFVIVNSIALVQTPTVALGPLSADDALALMQTQDGRQSDADNRRVAIGLGATVGQLPGPTRLIGIAARVLQASFISLLVKFSTGDAISRALVASLSSVEQRILGSMAIAHAPLAARHITYIVGCGDLAASLERLLEDELVRVDGDGMYELPSYIERIVPALPDADIIFARAVDVFCDAFDPSAKVPVFNRQSAAAERLVHIASERSHSGMVLALAPRLAQHFGTHGMFGGWGRMLDLFETAAAHAGDPAALNLARHDLGVRALLLGERPNAIRYLRAAIQGRQSTGDAAGADASRAVLTLAGAGALADDPMPTRDESVREPSRGTLASAHADAFDARAAASPRKRPLGVGVLLVVGLCIVALAMLGVAFRHRPAPAAAKPATTAPVSVAGLTVAVHQKRAPQPLRIIAFSARPTRIAAGQSMRLCYAVTGAQRLRVVPGVGNVTRLRACQTIVLREPRRHTYELSVIGENGRRIVRHVGVDVVAAASTSTRSAARSAPGERTARHVIYQFDATPAIVERGQASSLCVGVARPARAFVTHLGRLVPGLTRCYRVQPRATTAYRLYVALQTSAAVETVTIAVRPPVRRRDVARAHR